jgi:hypothetical protein
MLLVTNYENRYENQPQYAEETTSDEVIDLEPETHKRTWKDVE